jgi:hypothetical protein
MRLASRADRPGAAPTAQISGPDPGTSTAIVPVKGKKHVTRGRRA